MGSSDTFTLMLDVMTTSYNYASYELYHRRHPFRPFMGGESASCWSDRGYYAPTNASAGHVNMDFTGASAPACASAAWAAAASTDWASGSVAWTVRWGLAAPLAVRRLAPPPLTPHAALHPSPSPTRPTQGMDYMGEPGPGSWPDKSSHFGALDLAGFPKDRAAYYSAWWGGGTASSPVGGARFILVSPQDWSAPVPVGQPVHVYAFTAAPAAEAFLNGASLGLRNVSAFGFADWGAVAFAPGNLTAVAYDARGAVAAVDSVLGVGPAARVVVALEAPPALGGAAPPYAADGADVAIARVAVVDAAGSVVPGAAHLLHLAVAGPGAVYGVGNGDPADHTPDKVGRPDLPFGGVWAIPAFHGLARVLVQTQAGAPGAITLTASAPGLQSGNVTFTSV